MPRNQLISHEALRQMELNWLAAQAVNKRFEDAGFPCLYCEERHMPLKKSKSKAAFKSNVREMVKSGHPVKQAVAAAYSEKRAAGKRK